MSTFGISLRMLASTGLLLIAFFLGQGVVVMGQEATPAERVALVQPHSPATAILGDAVSATGEIGVAAAPYLPVSLGLQAMMGTAGDVPPRPQEAKHLSGGLGRITWLNWTDVASQDLPACPPPR